MDNIAILDFGGQYAHLICNRIRRLGVHAVIMAPTIAANELANMKGLILSGGPQSVNAPDALMADPKIFELGIPVLGICYGHQLTNKMLGGKVQPGKTKEYGKTKLFIDRQEGIFKNLFKSHEANEAKEASEASEAYSLQVWMSHWDEVTEMPVDFEVLGHTDINDFAAVGNLKKNIYGIQFHPEVTHTEEGMKILENFVNLTGAEKTWSTKNYLERITQEILSFVIGKNPQPLQRQAIPRFARNDRGTTEVTAKKIFMLVSGGVDSLVAFALLNNVLGQDRVYGLLVDTGFMRKGEIEEVSKALDKLGFHNLHVADAKQTFYKALEGIGDPEEKRRIIGRVFVEVQAKALKTLHLHLSQNPKPLPEQKQGLSTTNSSRPTPHDQLPTSSWLLGQGTIYPDTIESGGTKHADKIKTHHNRVPEIQAMIEKGLVIEPLKDLYKDEVRELGELLGLPHHLVWRHPFPGPGLAIRILCSSSVIPTDPAASACGGAACPPWREESLSINSFLKPHGLTGTILPIRSVGVQGDARTYRHPLAITPLNSKTWQDFWNYDKLQKLSTELTNRFGSINRVILQLAGNAFSTHYSLQTTYLSPSRISLLQEADKIVMDEINTFDLEEKTIWQCPTVLLPLTLQPNSYNLQPSLVLRPVSSVDAMTANFVLMPQKNLENILKKLANLKPSAVFYDLTNKPPGTIEWE